ncbi:DegV family protein with EDD domain [Streptohalobacillus salinus]|uniref:DegV family protein with EDD domain n=1 Tax=Streptohalobacillus salinus TaxID=621096 RepID=A0A2V3WHT9_9BACI|nr:DegV family protein [Streptohalobacillus salinus]PXW93101.1 DegV family protein with EDD domain [Streptohalobacillus salinus]
MTVQIICDSASDLATADIEALDLIRVSLTVQLDGNDYKDGQNLEAKTMYDRMREGASPKTSQVTPQDFEDAFMKVAAAGKEALYLAFSSELSGTYQSAIIARDVVLEKYPETKIEIVDTLCASLGYGLVVKKAAELAQEGLSLAAITAKSTYYAEHMEHIFTVDDLEYLYRGGRVSKTAAFMGTLLKIKPILHVDDGKLIPLEKIRGTKKAYNRIFDIVEERATDLTGQTVGISHGDVEDVALELAEIFKTRFGVKEVVIRMVGSAVGAHSGPGTIAIFFQNQL